MNANTVHGLHQQTWLSHLNNSAETTGVQCDPCWR